MLHSRLSYCHTMRCNLRSLDTVRSFNIRIASHLKSLKDQKKHKPPGAFSDKIFRAHSRMHHQGVNEENKNNVKKLLLFEI